MGGGERRSRTAGRASGSDPFPTGAGKPVRCTLQGWLREQDLNLRPPAHEAGELAWLLYPAKEGELVPRWRRSLYIRGNRAARALRRMNGDWWSQAGSNRRPPACHAGALPAELWPRRCEIFISRRVGDEIRSVSLLQRSRWLPGTAAEAACECLEYSRLHRTRYRFLRFRTPSSPFRGLVAGDGFEPPASGL